MTGPKFIICALLTSILVIGSDIKTTPAQIKRDKISFNEAFSRNIFNNSDNPQLTELDSALYSVSKDSKRERILGSYILIGLGTASIIQGLLLLNDSGEFAIIGAVFFLLNGAIYLPIGLHARSHLSDVEKYYIEFGEIPETTPDKAERKLKTGELRFEKFARSSRRSRYIISGLITAWGISLAFEGSEEFLLGVSMVGMGVWRYKSKLKLEKTYDRYIEKKEIYSSTDVGNNLSWKMFPLPGKGVGGVVSLEF